MGQCQWPPVPGEEHSTWLSALSTASINTQPASPQRTLSHVPDGMQHAQGSSSALAAVAAGTNPLGSRASRAWWDPRRLYPVHPPPQVSTDCSVPRCGEARLDLWSQCPVPSMRDEHVAGLCHASWGRDPQEPQVAIQPGDAHGVGPAGQSNERPAAGSWGGRGRGRHRARWERVWGWAAGMQHTGTLFGWGGRKSGRWI